MATKSIKRSKTFVRKKTTTSPIKKIEKKLEKQEEVLEEIKTLIENESNHPASSFLEKTSVSTTKEVKSVPIEEKIPEPIAIAPKPKEEVVLEEKEEEQEEETNEPKKSRKALWINLFIVFIGSFLIVTFFLFLRQKKIDEIKQLEANTPTPTVAVSSSPTQVPVDISKYTISVLNGSGKAGEAAKAKTLLVGEDYTVETVGNASESTYEETLIKAKKSVPSAFIDALKKSLESSYVLDPIVAEFADTKNTDVEIIIGSETP